MWKIKKIVKKGDYRYAVVKNHPKATTTGYILLHRIIMENYLNRILEDDEVVHHVDENKLNNKISNLELMRNVDHARYHARNRTRKWVRLKCPICTKTFEIPKNKSFLGRKQKISTNCCSRSCSGKLSQKIKNKRNVQTLEQNIKTTLISEFEK